MALLMLIAIIILFDQGIKDTIERTEDSAFPKEVDKTGGTVVLHKHHNPGLPMGFLAAYPQLVKQIPTVVTAAVAGILAWMFPRKGNVMQKLGLAIVTGGSISNLYDRFARGFVVDYLNIRWKKLGEIVFNLGDVCIFLGAVLFTAGEFISGLRGK